MDAHLILFGTRLHTNKPILIAWISIVFILGRNRFYYSKTDCVGMRSRAPPDFIGHLRFWKQKLFRVELAGVFTRKKFTVIILRNLKIYHSESGKWKFEKIVTLFHGRMTKKKCLSHKIRWLISPISCCTSLAFCDTLFGWWMNGKFSFLDKVAFKVACKGVWCLYNRQNSKWLLVDIGLLLSISHERVHWTRDIWSWSLEEKLHWYNTTHGVNSSLSIQLWQSVTCTSLRRKGIFLIARVLHWKRKN